MLTKFSNYDILLTVSEAIEAEGANKPAMNKMRKSFTQIITNFGFFADLLFKKESVPVSVAVRSAKESDCNADNPSCAAQDARRDCPPRVVPVEIRVTPPSVDKIRARSPILSKTSSKTKPSGDRFEKNCFGKDIKD